MRIIKFGLGIAALVFAGLIASCSDDDDVCTSTPDLSGINEAQLQADTTGIEAYLDENSIEATVHPSGIRYVIIEEGGGAAPQLCDWVEIKYTGRLMSNGEIFDQTPYGQVSNFQLSNLILGWQIGLPLIKEGGEIRLYIPSQLAYGKQSSGSISANSNLIFTIELINVQ